MFSNTYLKLSGLYLAVFMMISLFFSVSLYQISMQEVQGEIQWRSTRVGRIMIEQSVTQSFRNQYILDVANHYDQAKTEIIARLMLVNIFVLIAGGILSYLLAKWTLKPIEQAHQSLEQFTADASHELRTPIAAMQTETEVALMDPKLTVKGAKAQLVSNLEELGKMTNLTDRLLKLAIISDKSSLQKQPIAVMGLLEPAISRVIGLASQKNITINNLVNNEHKLYGDPSSLEELLVIFLENSIKYSNKKTTITVTSRYLSKKIIITVADEGQGIEQADLARIFDRFYRSDTSRTKNESAGFGLGLAIAKNIAQLNNAKISVKSKAGVGSAFSIELLRPTN